MDLDKKIRDLVMFELSNCDLSSWPQYAQSSGKVLEALLDGKFLDRDSLQVALEQAIYTRAKRDYKLATRTDHPKGTDPEYIGSPFCLAYTIRRGGIVAEDAKKLIFDHGETLETFCETYYSPRLPEVFLNDILQISKELRNHSVVDPHPACCP